MLPLTQVLKVGLLASRKAPEMQLSYQALPSFVAALIISSCHWPAGTYSACVARMGSQTACRRQGVGRFPANSNLLCGGLGAGCSPANPKLLDGLGMPSGASGHLFCHYYPSASLYHACIMFFSAPIITFFCIHYSFIVPYPQKFRLPSLAE